MCIRQLRRYGFSVRRSYISYELFCFLGNCFVQILADLIGKSGIVCKVQVICLCGVDLQAQGVQIVHRDAQLLADGNGFVAAILPQTVGLGVEYPLAVFILIGGGGTGCKDYLS